MAAIRFLYSSMLSNLVLIDIFKKNEIKDVEILFGWAWGNEYKVWTPFNVEIDNILDEIYKAEKTGYGNFYKDDIFITLNEFQAGIRFCHEHDIHINYNSECDIVLDIVSAWEKKKIIQK
jgi:hypothetical protein